MSGRAHDEAANRYAVVDADYVLCWLRQTKAPENIIALQQRALAALARLTVDTPGQPGQATADSGDGTAVVVEYQGRSYCIDVWPSPRAAGVSGGTPPSEPEDERPGDAHKADSPVQASGSLGGNPEAGLGGDGGLQARVGLLEEALRGLETWLRGIGEAADATPGRWLTCSADALLGWADIAAAALAGVETGPGKDSDLAGAE